MTNNTHPRQQRFIAIRIAAGAAILLAIGLIIFASLNYTTARQLADSLAADGSLDSFTPQVFNLLKIGLIAVGSLLLIGGGASITIPQKALWAVGPYLVEIKSAFLDWPRDAGATFRELRSRLLRKDVLLPLFAFTVLAFLARILYISDPMRHDEAYSFVIFAKLPLRLAIADYHFPNNHLFNTLLMHIADRLFGDAPWVVRLPAFTAGVSLVPTGYLLTRRMYGKTIALAAGAVLAAWPTLIHYSTNARGYSLMALFTVLVMLLAIELTRRSNSFLWSLAALFSALGFYTVPIFLLPFGIAVTWLILSGLDRRVIAPAARSTWFTRLVLFILSTGLLTLIFYLPVFRYSGIGSVLSNAYVESLSWRDFLPTLISRLQETAVEWTLKVPLWVIILMIAGFGLSLILHRRISQQLIAIQLAALIFITLDFLVQRPNAWSKIWQFLMPFALIWAAAGLVGGLEWLARKLRGRVPLATAGVWLAVAGLVALAAANAVRDHPGLRPITGRVEKAAIYLSAHLQEDDIVVITAIDDAPMWYYFYKYDLSPDYFRRDIPFKKAYVLVSRDQDQTVDLVISQRGPDPGFFDMKSTVLLEAWDDLELYAIDANWEAVRKAYNITEP